jgi:hypothetical protein
MSEEIKVEEFAPWLVLLITLIGGVLRIFSLDYKGMGLDETFSVWLANQSIAELLQWIVKVDHNPPLYYLLLHYWVAGNGVTPYAVRLLSVLFGVGTIPMVYLIGKRLSGVVMGLAAAVILAFSPFNIRFAQEARMYTLLTFNAAVAIYALVWLLTDPRSVRPIGSQFWGYLRAWRTPGPVEPDTGGEFSYQDETRNQTRWRAWMRRHRWLPIQTIETDLAWVAFIVFSAATMLSHNAAVLFPLATNIFVLGLMLFQRIKRPGSLAFQVPSFWNWVKAQVGILLLWSPWIRAFIRQAGQVYQEFWLPRPSWTTVLQTLGSFLDASTPSLLSKIRMIWILYAVVLCLGLLHFRKKVSRLLFLATLIAIPFLGELIVSIRQPIFCDRTLIWTAIPLFMVLAAGIAQLRFRFLIVAMVGVLVTINLFSAGDYYRFVRKEDWSIPAGYVANFAQEGDLVLFDGAWVQVPFDYYFGQYENLYSIHVEKRGLPKDMVDSSALKQKVTDSDLPRLISLLSGRKRVWLVYDPDGYTDPTGLVPQTLASKMELTRQRDFYGGQVQLYEMP